MGGKKKYIEMFGSFTEPFNCTTIGQLCNVLGQSRDVPVQLTNCAAHIINLV